MTVWIAESGEYEQRGIDGVFDTVERAMAVYGGEWKRTLWCWFNNYSSGDLDDYSYWQEWTNGEVTVKPWDVANVGKMMTEQCKVVIQKYNPENQGWLYLEGTHEEADQLIAYRKSDV